MTDGDGWLPLRSGNLYDGCTFASAVRPFGPVGGISWFDTFDQPVPGVGGRCAQDLSWDSHLPTPLFPWLGDPSHPPTRTS